MSLYLPSLELDQESAEVLARFELQDLRQLNRFITFILDEHYSLQLQQLERFYPGQLTCRVRTNGGRFFLKVYEKETPRDLVPGQIRLMKNLLELGVPCPEILTDQFEQEAFNCNGFDGFLMSCIDGFPLKADDQRQVDEAGRLLGRMHDAAYQLYLNEADYLGRWFAVPRLMDEMYELHIWIDELLDWAMNENDGKGQNLLEEASQLILRACDRYSQYQFPRMMLHGRPKGSHFLQNHGLLLGLVDFDWSGIGERIRDLAYGAVNLGDAGHTFAMMSFGLQKRFIAGYDAVMPLTKYELQSLPAILLWSHLLTLRWLLAGYRLGLPFDGKTINQLLSNMGKWVNECR